MLTRSRIMNSRREFLQQSGAIASGLSLLSASQATAAPQPDGGSQEWYGRPMRWFQLAFVEDDPGQYDQAFWLDYFKRIHADAVCLSAGGCVAFYPTKIPLHYRSKFLGKGDTFGEMVAG